MDSPSAPEFSGPEVRRHVSQFLGHARASDPLPIDHRRSIENYIGARMHDFNMQPALGRRYMAPFHLPERYPRKLTLEGSASDGAPLSANGLRVDPRSGTGRIAFSSVVFNPEAGADLAGMVAVIGGDEAADDRLRQLSESRAAAVIIAGTISEPAIPRPVPNLLVISGSRSHVAQTLGLDRQQVTSRVGSTRHVVERLPQRISMQVARDYSRRAPMANLMGIVSGKVPVRDSELVIVCAEFGGSATGAGAAPFRNHSSAAGAAAVLELGRKYGQYARFGPFPERSVMFALWSGTDHDHAGLRAYLASPAWPPGNVRHVIWVGAPEAARSDIEEIIQPYGYRLTVIERRAPDVAQDGSVSASAEVEEALRLARQAAVVLYREARGRNPREPVLPRPTP